MILELKQCNDSKKFESTCTDHPRIKHLQPHSVSIFPRILSFHPSIHYSVTAYSILIDSVFHSRWLLYFLFLLTHTHSFHQFYIKLLKATILHLQLHVNQPFSLSAWPLVCYRSVHTPLFTRVQLQSTQLLPQSFWLPLDMSHLLQTHIYIYYGFCCSVYLSVSIVISSLCFIKVTLHINYKHSLKLHLLQLPCALCGCYTLTLVTYTATLNAHCFLLL